ncbi:MAG: GAF domain-containing protein, partial [Acidobacteriota bacterium]
MSNPPDPQSPRAKTPDTLYNALDPESRWTSLGESLARMDDLKERDPIQWALRERVKELVCLYGIAKVTEKPGTPLEEMARGIAALLPPSWQHPDVSTARINIDGRAFCSKPFAEGPFRQTADVVVNGAKRGEVEVFYLEQRPEFDEGPFLKEERSLINEVARQVALVLERRQAETER